MRALAAEGVRVQCCVTSPPYFGLRDYGHPGQVGLEETPDKYVAAMVEVFREVRRVLRDDGTLWLNLGDSYAAARGGTSPPAETLGGGQGGWTERGERVNRGRFAGYTPARDATSIGLKHKDLVGIPWRVAFALQDDGWYLRQDIIWHKPNPMPESVTDRCTKSHEYLFLLAKSERYFYDAAAIKEPAASAVGGRTGQSGNKARKAATGRGCPKDGVDGNVPWKGETRNKRSVWTVPVRAFKGAHFATFPPDLIRPCILAGSRPGDTILDPFMGAGTTALVAREHGRSWIGCEINEEYGRLCVERLSQPAPGVLF
jgi:DNA modification methylase